MKKWTGFYTKEHMNTVLASMGVNISASLPRGKQVRQFTKDGFLYTVTRANFNSTYDKPLYKYTIEDDKEKSCTEN